MTRIDEEIASLGGGDLDEARASIPLGTGGRIGVVSAGREAIHAALGRHHGTRFGPTRRLDQTGERAYRGFVSTALDAAGMLHVPWINSRFAPRSAELYYVRIQDDEVVELNLMADQEASIYGCCRTNVSVTSEGRVRVTCRNTTAEGYRDIYRVEGDTDGRFGAPRRVGPQMHGCPVKGPVTFGDVNLWNEASTGKRRLWAASFGDVYDVVLEGDDGWGIASPPGPVAGIAPGELLLVLGRPIAKLLRRAVASWSVALEGIPQWATSAVQVGDDLVLVGAMGGRAYGDVERFRYRAPSTATAS